MPVEIEPAKRSGTLGECIRKAVQEGFTGRISYEGPAGVRASVIFVSGKPSGASYTDEAGSMYGDVAVLRLPAAPIYTQSPLPEEEAEYLASSARIYHPQRLFAQSGVKERNEDTAPAVKAGAGVLTVRVESGRGSDAALKIELWSQGRICASDTPGPDGKASFKLLKGEYECRLREGIRLIGRSAIMYPGGDMDITLPADGGGG